MKPLLSALVVLIGISGPAFAQAPERQPGTAAAPQSAPRPPRTIRFDVTITDTGGPKPVTKTMGLTMAAGGGEMASIRSGATMPGIIVDRGYNTDKEGRIQQIPSGMLVVPLNFDVRSPTIYDDLTVRANITVEYQPVPADGKTPSATVRASSTSVFENGKKTVLLQAADPVSDRRTTIEVTATVLK
jgi:hypothetical protein